MVCTQASADQVKALQAQQAALGNAVSVLVEGMGGVRPDVMESLKRATQVPVATGPMLTKFKCLTCDQAINPPQSPDTSTSATGRRGGFLPRLDPLPPQTHGSPIGPGLAAAELREMSQSRAIGMSSRGGLGVTGLGSRGSMSVADVDEYAGVSSMSRVDRSRASRVSLGTPPSHSGPRPGTVPHKPVFIG